MMMMMIMMMMMMMMMMIIIIIIISIGNKLLLPNIINFGMSKKIVTLKIFRFVEL